MFEIIMMYGLVAIVLLIFLAVFGATCGLIFDDPQLRDQFSFPRVRDNWLGWKFLAWRFQKIFGWTPKRYGCFSTLFRAEDDLVNWLRAGDQDRFRRGVKILQALGFTMTEEELCVKRGEMQ